MIEVWIDGSTTKTCVIIEGFQPKVEDLPMHVTNNVGEYHSLLRALFYLIDLGFSNKEVTIYSDSELMVHQVNTRLTPSYKPVYACRAEHLQPLLAEVLRLVRLFSKGITLCHVCREENKAGRILG